MSAPVPSRYDEKRSTLLVSPPGSLVPSLTQRLRIRCWRRSVTSGTISDMAGYFPRRDGPSRAGSSNATRSKRNEPPSPCRPCPDGNHAGLRRAGTWRRGAFHASGGRGSPAPSGESVARTIARRALPQSLLLPAQGQARRCDAPLFAILPLFPQPPNSSGSSCPEGNDLDQRARYGLLHYVGQSLATLGDVASGLE